MIVSVATAQPASPAACRSCGEPSPPLVLDLGQVPASDQFPPVDAPGPDPMWRLTLHACDGCGLVQLGPGRGAQPEPQAAVDSSTALEHAAASVAAVVRDERLEPGRTVIELDSSHGASWLPWFVEAGLVEVGRDEQADLVVDVHHLMHEEDIDAVVAAHAARLADGGRLVCEFFHLLPLVRDTLVDTIRHGHFVYLSLLAAAPLFERNGLTITRAAMVDVYGGSLRVTAARTAEGAVVDESVDDIRSQEQAAGLDRLDSFVALGARGSRVAEDFRTHLEQLARQGRRVAGYGAPSKAAVLLALSRVDRTLLPYTVDLSPAKHGCRVPGAGVPIHSVERLLADRPDDVVILTWDIADEVVAQLRRMSVNTGWAPQLHVPLPIARDLSLAY